MEIAKELKPVHRGAEAYLYLIDWFGEKAILKHRLPKKYRHSKLDILLRRRRTVTEARAIKEALRIGVMAPAVYYVDPMEAIIVMEYLPYPSLSSIIEEGNLEKAIKASEQVGRYAAMLHEEGISHGDLTTSNVLVGDHVFLIDFGLASLHSTERDNAVDVHLFLRSLESTHPEHVDTVFQAFIDGYRSLRGEKTEKILGLVEEIRLMGRYKAERRTLWGQQ